MNEPDRVDIISKYLDDVREQFESGQAIEHAYRPALKTLMSNFEDTVAVNDPKHSEHGAPDFVFLKRSNSKIIKGYAEAKDVTVSLDKTEKSDQMQRYAGYANLFLTDYLDFRFFRNGEKYETISLGHVKHGELHITPENGERLARELEAFLTLPPEQIRSGKRLAQIMGGKARRIRDNVVEYLTSDDIDSDELNRIYEMMTKLLVHDLEPNKFADMYAQTLVYGLFVARYGDDTPDSFTRSEARDLVPKSNPFLRHFFDHIVGPNFDTRLRYIVDELCEIFSVSNVQEIVHRHLRIQDVTNDAKDPIIHFYEDFLQEYDPKVRKEMGAYYTPTPVVKFIVRNVDKILREDFGIAKGLASDETFTKQVDIGQEVSVVKAGNTRASKTSVVEKQFHRVQLLDPAVGTATFLNETIKFIYEQFKGQEGRWSSYVADNLIHRLHGFELMMAPYTIAHLKLGMTLKETGVDNLNNRLGVYLTNTLEEGVPGQQDLFSFGLAQAVSEESQHAAEIKSERPIMIVMGNPPYSGVSSNETVYANSLIAKYKVEPGGVQSLQERKHWLNDDYVKFLAFAEDMVNKNGSGIVAMITNNGYLDNPTFRGMRWQLARTFDKIYVLDLHGNSNKKETSPDGSKDENVFDIMQGVGIILAVKNASKTSELADIFHADIYGKRQNKFDMLNGDIEFKKVELLAPSYYFIAKDTTGQPEYNQGIPLNSLFTVNVTGVVSARDKVVIGKSRSELIKRLQKFVNLGYSDEEIRRWLFPSKKDGKYKAGDTRGWKLELARRKIANNNHDALIQLISYRPFDTRFMYYTPDMVDWGRESVMSNFIGHNNIGLVTTRFQKENPGAFLSETIIGHKTFNAYDSNTVFPLYIYHDEGTYDANFNQTALKKLATNLSGEISPEDVLDYIYAVLYSPSYRKKYKEFLKTDFPRVPVPTLAEFDRLVPLGRKLRELHLMKSSTDYDTTFPESGTNAIDQIKYQDGEVWINDTQYFGNVPELAWNFYIGGYQPAQKWLKDRKGCPMSNEDLTHYQQIIKILLETDRIMKEIDG